MDFKSLLKDINNRNFKNLYLFQGEEPYYIDLLVKALQEKVLEEHEKDFNETIVYGKDCNVLSIISDANSFPLMADYKLIIIKEAQDIKEKDFELFEHYFQKPSSTTILAFAHKYKKLDARKKTSKMIAEKGLIFNSEKIKDYLLPNWLNDYIKSKKYTITERASSLLLDSIGNDLSRIVNELEKLTLVVQEGTAINEVHIEENIGISKEYNVFELNNAVAIRDFVKAMKIVDYFEHNPKAANIQHILMTFFNHFTKLMRVHSYPDKNPASLAGHLKMNEYAVKELIKSSKIYPIKKAAANISYLHEYDLKSKGVNNSNFSDSDLLKELIFKLLH